MPSGTSWLPLERVKTADAVVGDVRWLEGVRAVFAQARKENVITLLDADSGAREALPGLLQLTDYAIFSAPALRDFVPSGGDAERLQHVLTFGPRHAGVTLGADGYLWRERTGGGHVPAFSVTVTDTTGAGDAFHGTFALMLAEGRSSIESARTAAAAAALKCTRLGSRAGLPLRAQLQAFERSRS
jgi:sulfofructose kinase